MRARSARRDRASCRTPGLPRLRVVLGRVPDAGARGHRPDHHGGGAARRPRADRLFYDESGGGVTFSGGEPLRQWRFLVRCLEAARARGYHVAVDTSGFASERTILRVAEAADLFLYDLKVMDPGRHRQFTGVGLPPILRNLRALDEPVRTSGSASRWSRATTTTRQPRGGRAVRRRSAAHSPGARPSVSSPRVRQVRAPGARQPDGRDPVSRRRRHRSRRRDPRVVRPGRARWRVNA